MPFLSLRSSFASVACGWIATVAFGLPLRAEEFSFYHENVLGTSLELHVQCEDRKTAQQAERIALAEIDRLAEVYGHYTPTSEFGRAVRLAPGERMEISEELMGLLQRSQRWTALSAGAFNPAAESFTQCWKRAALRGELPSDEELKHIAFRVNREHWLLDAQTHSLTRLGQEGLSLNAIAKGTILDAVAQAMMTSSSTVEGAAVVLGGDMRTIGKTKTKIAIAHPHRDALGANPLAEVALQDRGIATSGSSERFVLIGGKRYSHIIDPTTGTPCSQTASATVIAPNAETADVVATICVVMPARQALNWLAGLPGVHGCLVLATGQVLVTEGWDDAVGTQDEAKTTASKPDSPHEFLVEFEIAKPENGGRYRRPYVAVWVEDQDDYPVKTLSLFLMADNPGPRWHRDLRRWYASDQLRLLADESKLIGKISKPTRNPGDYKVAWDGTDDHGQLLRDGKYTLYVEAAREHGTYQLIKVPFELGGKPFEESPKGNVEIKSVTFTYKHQPK